MYVLQSNKRKRSHFSSGLLACLIVSLLSGCNFSNSDEENVASVENESNIQNKKVNQIKLHPHEGSGVVGSPELVELTEEWKLMNRSDAKQRGRNRFSENKYGMFIHWGLYSGVGGVWKGERVDDSGKGPKVAEWVMRRKEIPREEYSQLAKTFNPTKFDAKKWVAIAKAAGMNYMVITSKHHDGFALFDSEASEYNVVDATPFGRDVIKELEEACKEADIDFGVYYSNSIDWFDGGDGGWKDYRIPGGLENKKLFFNDFDPSPTSFDDYIRNKSIPQVKELLANYDLTQIWFDTPLFIPPKYSMEFYKTVYDANPEILVNQRIGNGFGDIGTPGDNVIPDKASTNTWEGIATTNNSWGYKSYDNDWKSPIETLFWLVENVSKGGNFLLNVGPDGAGKIPEKSVENLLVVGDWLKINGEAIYGSKPWQVSHEGPTKIAMKGTHHRAEGASLFNFTSEDFWFTKKEEIVYAISLNRSSSNKFLIKSFAGKSISYVELLGSNKPVKWESIEEGLNVKLPSFKDDSIGFTLKVSFN